MRYLFMIIMCGCLLMSPQLAWSMSEDEYVQMAVENLKTTHQAKGDNEKLASANAEFFKKYSQALIAEYLTMAQEIMADPQKAGRIHKKIMESLRQMGYRVHADDSGAVIFDK